MKVLSNTITDLRVQLKGHLRPFEVATYLCDNPDCPCTNATLEFTEIEEDGSDVSRPICFGFKLDIETWQKHENTNHSEQINALIDEFINDLSDEMKAMFTEAYDRRGERKRKLANFSMPVEDIRRGMLVSFSEVMSDTDKYNGLPAYGFTFTAHDRTYYIDDLYCPNPKCDCKNVFLLFLKSDNASDGEITLSEAFLATLSLGGKNLAFSRLGSYSQSQATALVSQWLESDPEATGMFRPRYNDIRRTTKRILKTSRNSLKNIKAPPLIVRITNKQNSIAVENTTERVSPSALPEKTFPPVGKIGRNDPCPCGSGKKYKRCCANRQEAFR